MMKQHALPIRKNLNSGHDLKAAMNLAAQKTDLSRLQIMDRMQDLCGQYGISHRISVDMLEKWLNPRDASRWMPLPLLPVFFEVVGTCAPARELVAPFGGEVIDPGEARKLAWAKKKLAARELGREIKALESGL